MNSFWILLLRKESRSTLDGTSTDSGPFETRLEEAFKKKERPNVRDKALPKVTLVRLAR